MNAQNAFQYFTVAGFINAVLLSFLLFKSRIHHQAKYYMIALVLIVTFQAILNAFDNREFFLALPHLSKISWLLPSVFGPLVYLFTTKLCSPSPDFRKQDMLHFIPVTVYLAFLMPWYMKSAEIKRAYLTNFEKAAEDDFGFLNQFSILLIFVYLLATVRYLHTYRKQIKDTFSEISKKKIEWMELFSYFILIILFISALGFYGEKWNVPVIGAIYHYNYFLTVLLVYWIGYKALMQPAIFDLPANIQKQIDLQPAGMISRNEDKNYESESLSRKYERSGLDEKQTETMYHRLMDFMISNKPYLDPELNIFQLANLLNIKKHHLSRIINEKAGMNFFDFINTFRVEETKRNLASGKTGSLTLLAVALDSGFNSKATFNVAFKKLTGLTPSEFQKNHKNQV